MNVQAHMSGQMSGQVPNQMPQQNVNSLQPQVQNYGGVGGLRSDNLAMDAELIKARKFMQHKICGMLASRHSQPLTDAQKVKFMDIVKRVEEGLFKSAPTKEDYMNVDTLEHRIQVLIRRSSMNRNQQRQQHANSSSSIGTMIPTPGMSHSGNSNMMLTSAVDTAMLSASNNMATANVNTGSLLPTGNGPAMGMPSGSFSAADGILSNGYQTSPSSFSVASGGNQLSSLGGQRMTGQMIPTPGFNSNNSNQAKISMDSSNGGAPSTSESSIVPQQTKQHVGAQNDHILQRFGNHTGSGMRSSIQQKSYGFPNGGLSGGMGISMQPMNGPTVSEGYLTTAPYANSSNLLQQQRPLIQGDGFGMNSTDSSGSGNLYGSATSIAPMMSAQSLSSVNLQSMPNTSTSLMSNQLNIHTFPHAADVNSQLIDHSEKINFQSPSSRENLLHHQQQLQQQPQQLQSQQKIIHQKDQLKLQNQHNQVILRNDPTGQDQQSSNLVGQVKPEPGFGDHGLIRQQHVSEQNQLPKSQNQFNYEDDLSRGATPTLPHNSQQMQQLQPQVASDFQSNYSSFSGAQPGCKVENQWHPQSQEGAQMSMLHKQHVQDDFCQRISRQDEAQPNKFGSEGSNVNQAVASRTSVEPPNSGGVVYGHGNANREKQFINQRRWLLFLRHARHCTAPEGKCPEYHCVTVQKLWKHMENCNFTQCSYPRCHVTQALLVHNKNCRNPGCPVCVPVRNYIIQQRIRHNHLASGATTDRLTQRSASESNEDLHPVKRAKLVQPLPAIPEEEKSVSNSETNKSHVPEDVQQQDQRHGEMNMPIKSEVTETKMGVPVSSALEKWVPAVNEAKEEKTAGLCNQLHDREPNESDELAEVAKQENVKVEKETEVPKQEIVAQSDNGTGTKSGKPNIKGVSLTELFTPEQVREHIRGLRQWIGQSKAKAERHQAMERSMSENSCQLCAVEKLTFEPPPIYCTLCGARIKRNAMYYTVGAGDTRHYFCIPCYNESRGDTITIEGATIPKARLEKKKNDEETEEWWVQCDKCEAWQHQICALFNGRRNDGGQAEYTCPYCYIKEVESGERKPLPQSAVLGAKDLPTTALSDHIEQRLFRRLKQERQERARVQGKRIDEVPGAEALVIRVVSSVEKKLEVKPRFLEIFQEENYPSEFPYKSKVVLLFQKIEGVEVCLFGMYVQEFASECAYPNKRRVYLSYLDSVKYFRPEVRAVTGEALRTFVYHEILIGYLEYCKIRGFTSCYIWACPPLKGEDYILYCHPEIQKTPKSDKLREWYLSMLKKASKENIVAELTNMYDHFFTQLGECKAKVTAARLPYFDGDYWPGAAEDMIYQMQQEEEGRKYNKKGSMKKTITKRALKASGQSDLSGNASKDLLLMHKLGETISPMKEDFIMVHLQHCCKHCCILMVSGIRWVCQHCKNFQLCDKCYGAEQNREDRERHPVNHKEKHSFSPVEITDVPAETKDEDEILESEFFDTRQAFLSLCQGNHYQYDTLRRAKHSSMMVLYHLHNPTAPAFVTTCNVCHLDIESGQGWRCEVCPDYDVCNACYQKDGGINHPHKLTNHPSTADRDAQNKEARQMRVEQLRKMLGLLVHASQCRSPQCQYPNCRKVKQLFRHGIHCKVRASGGCVLCKKMWYLLQLHARACKESECHVPRCRDLREHLRRLQQQSDSRRRAAVMEMMRQRAAEVASNVG